MTGERAKRSVKDTPSSVAVFRKGDIESLAAPDRLEQVLQLVPNVQLGSGGDAPSIRGQDGTGVLRDLPAFIGGARPRTTLQVDGRAVGYNEFAFGVAPLWDVDRVEVFRSPQSTTQGQNSIAGAIFIETANPTFDFESRFRLIGGDARTRQLSGAVSAPLVDDQLALRVSGDLRRSRTSSRLAGPIEGVNLNHDRYGTVRAKLLAEPNALSGFRLLLTYSHVASAMPQIEGVRPPFRLRRHAMVTSGYFRTNVDSLTAALTLPLATGLEARTTISFGDASIRRFAPPGFGETKIRGKDHSIESVLEWNPDTAVRIIGGVHVLAADLDQHIDLTAAQFGTGEFRDEQRSLGIFGDVLWRPAKRLTITGGLRFQHDGRDRVGALRPRTFDVPLDYRENFHALLPKVSVVYDLDPNIRVGAMVQRAYNPGGVTLDLRKRAEDRFDAERMWDYELFGRATFFGGTASIAANLFYNAISDAQRQQVTSIDTPAGPIFFSEMVNAPEARSFGAEVELGVRPSNRLSLRAGLGLLDTRITRMPLREDPMVGREFARAPHVTAAISADWWAMPKLRLSSQLRFNSRYFSDDSESPDLRIGASATADARASWQAGRFNLFAYARNLFDEFHLTYRLNPGTTGRALATTNDPREIGFGVEARY